MVARVTPQVFLMHTAIEHHYTRSFGDVKAMFACTGEVLPNSPLRRQAYNVEPLASG